MCSNFVVDYIILKYVLHFTLYSIYSYVYVYVMLCIWSSCFRMQVACNRLSLLQVSCDNTKCKARLLYVTIIKNLFINLIYVASIKCVVYALVYLVSHWKRTILFSVIFVNTFILRLFLCDISVAYLEYQ